MNRDKKDKPEIKQKSLDKALRVLECFTIETPELGVSDISRMLSLNKSNVFDILSTFEAREYLKKDPLTHKYSLYNASLRLAGVINRTTNRQDELSMMLRDLARETGETVYYGILYDNHVMYLDYISSSSGILPTQFIGVPAPLYCTATGKAILASLDNSYIESIVELGLKFTEFTLTNSDELFKDLEDTRKRGYSIDNMEHEYGIKGVGMVLKDETHLRTAMSVSGPSLRFTDETILKIAELLGTLKAKLSSSILY